MRKILVSPSILNADFTKLAEECQSLEVGGADMLHCDVMDGKFVPNVTFGASVVADIKKYTSLPLDVHLMVQDLSCVEDFIQAGASSVTVHVEVDGAEDACKLLKSRGVGVGLSLRPKTPVESLLPFADLFDRVLVMSVEPGFGGQKFMPEALDKIKRARELFPDKEIQVDGGINDQTGKLAVLAGATNLVAGSYIIKAADRKQAIEKLKNL